MSQSESEQKTGKESPAVLRAISVAGYKSIGERQRIEIRPLTLLAGANSGGKSSLIQPMLLLKQTLEAPYDPGSLLLDGPNVRLTSASQLLNKCFESNVSSEFVIGFDFGGVRLEFVFCREQEGLLEIRKNIIDDLVLHDKFNSSDIRNMLNGPAPYVESIFHGLLNVFTNIKTNRTYAGK
jgi:predicted ATPase